MQPSVSIILVATNAMEHVPLCLSSIFTQTYKNYQVLVVDNNSRDGTPEYIETHFPQVRLFRQDKNLGYRGGNSLGMQAADTDYIIVSNEDVEFDPNWLSSLVEAMEQHPEWGLATPRIMLFHKREAVNTAGNTFHFTGMYGPRGLGDSATDHNTFEELATVSGCCFIVRRPVLDELGGTFSRDFDSFDTGYHASFEDLDLAWRAQLAGYKVGYVPTSVMYHKHRPRPMMPSRFCDYEWGRYLVVLRNYSVSSLLLLFPTLVVLELAMWAYALSKGKQWVLAKSKVMKWLLIHSTEVGEMRRVVQNKRRVTDWNIVRRTSPTLRVAHLTQGIRGSDRLFNLLFALYYYLIFRPGVFVFSQGWRTLS